MAVFAMTREMGTRGKDVAAIVADRMGIEVVHHELVERHLAERMHVKEDAVHRFLEGDPSLWDRWNIDQRRFYRFTALEILEMAEKGNVIIRGWGAAQVLRDIPHVICARICAPMDYRLAEMRQRLRIDDDNRDVHRDLDRGDVAAIRREIDRSDNAHDRAVREHFSFDWRSPTAYNVVINSAMTPVAAAAEILLAMAGMEAFQETEASRTVLQDQLTLARIRATVDEDAQHTLGGRLELSIDNGVVTIDGISMQDIDLKSTVAAIEAVEGVKSVRNSVRRMPNVYTA